MFQCYTYLVTLIKSLLISIFIGLSVLSFLGLNNPVHQTIFRTFLPADTLRVERQYLLAYFRGQSALDNSKFKTSELSHIEDIKEVLTKGQAVYFYLLLVFLIWQIIEYTRKKSAKWLAEWRKQLQLTGILWPLIAIILVLAFEPLFIFFHQVVFPGGNWLFDPATDLIIKLYPPRFFFYFVIVWLVVTEVVISVLYLIIRASLKPVRTTQSKKLS